MTDAAPLSKIGFIMLGVSDMDASTVFYRDILGLEVSAQHGGLTFFNGGGVTLALSAELKVPLGKETAVEIVFSAERVRQSYESLRERGIVFRIEPRPVAGPMYATDFRDPDGHALSIFGPE